MQSSNGERPYGVLGPIVNKVLSALSLKHQNWTRRDRVEAALGAVLFFSSVIAFGNWYRYVHGETGVYVPLIWSGIALATVLVAPRKRMLLVGALGLYVLYGLKASLLDGDPKAWYLVVAALVLLVLVLATIRPSDSG